MSRLVLAAALLAVAPAVAVALPGTLAATGAVHLVDVTDDGYRDHASGTAVTTARVGYIVRFVLKEGTHTVTSGVASIPLADLGDLDSPEMSERSGVTTWDYTPTASGAYLYTCQPHPHMNGLLVVDAPD